MGLERTELNKFFYPESVAVVGVSSGDFRFGGGSFLTKLRESRFPGRLYPLNPKAEEIQGLKAYPDLSSLPEVPDLAIVCVAAGRVPSVLQACARIGLKRIHILTSGFKEIGTAEGKALEERIASISKENGLLVIGPNCMGPYCPAAHLTAWGAIPGASGPLGIISQSGGITQRLSEYMFSLGIGVEKAVSFGNGAVLDSMDFLEFMAEDEKIEVIAMYLESVKDGKEFLDLATEVNRKKPIILLKGGESSAGAKTVASHTGAMSGEQKLWKAFFQQTGVIQVRSLNEWADTVLAFCLLQAPTGNGVFLAGGGGGNSITNADTCVREGLEVPPLSEPIMEKMRRGVPEVGSIAGNPLDMFQIFQDASYLAGVLDLVYQDPAIAMVMVDRLIPRTAFHLPDVPDSTPEVIGFLKNSGPEKPTVITLDSDGGDAELAAQGAAQRARFCKAGIPAYPSVSRAAKAMVHLHRFYARKR